MSRTWGFLRPETKALSSYLSPTKAAMKEELRRESYQKHIQSEYWKRVREAVKARAGFRCQVCNGDSLLQAHHRTYKHFGQELDFLDDMTCLCKRCHDVFHGKELPRTSIGMGLVASKIYKPSLSYARRSPAGLESKCEGELIEITEANHRRLRCCKDPWHWMKENGIDPKTKGWSKRAIGKFVPAHFLK